MTTLTAARIPVRLATRSLALLALVVAAVLTLLPAPAEAARYAGGGYVGWHRTPDVDCRHKIWGSSSVLQMTAPPPTVYAYNARTGGGNDGAWVRYRIFLVDARTGQTLNSTGWSGFAWALDNRPAAWSGSAMFSPDARGQYVLDYRIEWWSGGASTYHGWSAYRADRYPYTAYNNVAGGVWTTCLKTY